jgi:CRISPR/Cas system CSM-associated protein Csm3 (group 7 of RAMP superfamily)
MTNQIWHQFQIELTTLEPLHIGGASNVLSNIDNPIVFLNGDIPAIPGTSIKGAWRSEIERYLIKYLEERNLLNSGESLGLKPCIPTPSNLLSDDEKAAFNDSMKYKRQKRFNNRDKKDEYFLNACDYDKNSDYICPACYLLGAQTLHGFIRVPFLTPAEGQSDINTLLYSIREDRAKGGAARSSNRGWYVVDPNTKFVGMAEILLRDKLTDWTFGKKREKLRHGNGRLDRWLDQQDWSLESIIEHLIRKRIEALDILGGYKWKGCGRVKIQVNISTDDIHKQLSS